MEVRHIQVKGGSLQYTDEGSGRPLVFVQGVWVSRDLWKDTTESLTGTARCIRVDWPLGGHREPFDRDADLSPWAIASMILDMLESLKLDDVVLVGNDTGGAVCQLAITSERPAAARITGLVLTNTDSYENFPPKAFRPVQWLARIFPAAANFLVARMVRGPKGAEQFMRAVCAKPVPGEKAMALLSNFASNRAVRADSLKFLARADARKTTLSAAPRFREFRHPVVLVWGDADQFFPLSDGERLASAFPNARLVRIPGAKTFIPLDAPEALSRELEQLARGHVPGAPT
jgi:pimeloyl-ACP methyl ester carboxylesterase